MKIVGRLAIYGLILTLTACGGGGGGDSSPSPQPSNEAPVASAGDPVSVGGTSLVQLTAMASSDVDGSIASYSWTQTAGTAVELQDSTSVEASFTAPDATSIEELIFEVTVTDNDGDTDSASVTVVVHPNGGTTPPLEGEHRIYQLHELFYEYQDLIGEKIWVRGIFANEEINGDGLGFLVTSMENLYSSYVLDPGTFARVGGALPPMDWSGDIVLVYGEVRDYADYTGHSSQHTTPLLLIEEYEFNGTPEEFFGELDVDPESMSPVASPAGHNVYGKTAVSTVAKGVQASSCDRVLIISGGVDDANNHERYRDNIRNKYRKLKELGFSDDQIDVLYNNGGAVEVDGKNVVDAASSKEKINQYVESIRAAMTGSCTLMVFVTDHGTGYDSRKTYKGARPVFAGDRVDDGLSHAESTFVFDGNKQIKKGGSRRLHDGKDYYILIDSEGKIKIYLVENGRHTLAYNAGKDVFVSEAELGSDLDGDGEIEHDIGYSRERIQGWAGETIYYNRNWDYDGDGTFDVRMRLDGDRYVAERRVGEQWREMGRDTDGDNIINSDDGGVDWNLDGDKNDHVSFYEGINLWGKEVLWDYEFADLLKPLSEMGIHIRVAVGTCFGGGLVEQISPYVESLYTSSSEDRVHYSWKADDGKPRSFDETAFASNLMGIDTDSWNAAATAASAADDAGATAAGHASIKNSHPTYETFRHATYSRFMEAEEDDQYYVRLDIPDDMVGDVYDFEFFFGLQNPRWTFVGFPEDLPEGLETELIPGGLRVFSDDPIPDELIFKILVTGASLTDQEKIRIEYTDVDHQRMGYTLADHGEFTLPDEPEEPQQPEVQDMHIQQVENCVNHTDHTYSSLSILEYMFFVALIHEMTMENILVSMNIETPSGVEQIQAYLNTIGLMRVVLEINSYGIYNYQINSAIYEPTGEELNLTGATSGSFEVTATETNKGQCDP